MSGDDVPPVYLGDTSQAQTELSASELGRRRQIRFSSIVSENFALDRILTRKLVEEAVTFWQKNGLILKAPPPYDHIEETSNPISVGFVVEGGTIWTTSFESYKKTASVSLTGIGSRTQVLVNLVLPGGIMSLRDREKAAELISAFSIALKSA